MKTYVVNDISPPVPYLIKFWVSSYWPKHCQPIKLHDSLKCNISWKKWMMNFIFGMQIKIEVHHFGCVYPGMSKVPKMSLHIFAISPEKHGRWGWCFLSVDKHKHFFASWKYHHGCASQACPKYPKQVYKYLCNISRKT